MQSKLGYCPDVPFANSKSYFEELQRVISKIPHAALETLVSILNEARLSGQTIFVFGNGGSAALASHYACDLGKGTSDVSSPRVRVVALTDNVATMTAWANDYGYEHIFAEQLKNLARAGDIAIAISGSGNSENVLLALEVARATGAITVGITGFKGGKMKEMCDLCIVVPSDNMQMIEDLHTCITHSTFTSLKARISASGAAKEKTSRDMEDGDELRRCAEACG